MEKITIEADLSKVSDGYHTIQELYDHRCALFMAWMLSDGRPGEFYWVPEHFEGWDLLVCQLPTGQISYHVPMSYRYYYKKEPQRAVEGHDWDGHTSSNVYNRILQWIAQ